jgi:DNA-binding XRE family transcriptional regulator
MRDKVYDQFLNDLEKALMAANKPKTEEEAKFQQDVSDLLLKYRIKAKMTQRQASEIIGITRTNYAHIEAGRHSINAFYLFKLAEVFNINVSEIYPEQEWKKKKSE